MTDARMRKIVQELGSREPRLAEVMARHRLCPLGRLVSPETHFESLVQSVVSQQLSVKAADTIYARLRDRAGGDMSPSRLIGISESDLRAVGVSGAKSRAIREMAEAVVENRISINSLHELEDDQAIASQLRGLWGIGAWTVDMFMMHQLGRLDIWPIGDVGVRRGWSKIFGLSEPIGDIELLSEGDRFMPYRSVVAWYCWQELDT